MSMTVLLLLAFGFMMLGALITGPPVHAHGRRAERADLLMPEADAQRILAGWATERSQELQINDPRPWKHYRGKRRAPAESWRARLAGWWRSSTAARPSPHAAVVAAMAGGPDPGRFAGLVVVRRAAVAA